MVTEKLSEELTKRGLELIGSDGEENSAGRVCMFKEICSRMKCHNPIAGAC
jgi:hypothetical protein